MEIDEGIIVKKSLKRRINETTTSSHRLLLPELTSLPPRKRHKAGSNPHDVLKTLEQLKISKNIAIGDTKDDFREIIISNKLDGYITPSSSEVDPDEEEDDNETDEISKSLISFQNLFNLTK